jgi:hypothetical protein
MELFLRKDEGGILLAFSNLMAANSLQSISNLLTSQPTSYFTHYFCGHCCKFHPVKIIVSVTITLEWKNPLLEFSDTCLTGRFLSCPFTAESEYWALTEEKVAAVLTDICQEPFANIQDKVRKLFEHCPT